MKTLKYFILILLVVSLRTLSAQTIFSTGKNNQADKSLILQQDTSKQETKSKSISTSGIFLSVGMGLDVPLKTFQSYSNVSFGVLARLEYSSTTIFPFVIGGEITYFNFKGSDNYKTINLLSSLQTKIFSYGLTVEYVLSRLFSSAYTIPFLTLDIKNNNINREYDAAANLPLIRKENRMSIGFGFGFTLFIFDFYTKYNYLKDVSNFGVYAKIKFPVIRF